MIYGSTYKVKVALNGYGWTLKDPQQKRSYPPMIRNPLHTSEETGRFHARWSSPPHMHYLASQGAPIVKALTLSTLNSQLKCTVDGVGASENPRKLKQKRKHTGHTNIHETQLRAIQVFNDRTPPDISVSVTSRMLPYIDIARRQTLLLISGSVREQAHRRPHTCKSENRDERNDRNQESWR